MLLESMTMHQVEQGLKKSQTLLLPFGALEEHGSHLPLSTDHLTIYEVCREAAQRTPVFVAPGFFYGVCRSTSQHTGTISITTSTLKSLAREVIHSSHAHGFRNFIMVSGHVGSNHMAALVEAGESVLIDLPDIKVAVSSIFDLVNSPFMDLVETPNDLHAGEIETALVMHLQPSWINGMSQREFPGFPKSILVRNKRKHWPGGVWGDPGKASVEKGKKFFGLLVEELVNLIRQVEQFEE